MSRPLDDWLEDNLPSFLSWLLDLRKRSRSRRAASQSVKGHAARYGTLLELGLA